MNTLGDSRSIGKALGLGVLVCGTLDITDAIVFYRLRSGVTATRLLQGIASVPFGPGAFRGGFQMASAGLLIHYAIATFWVCLFVLLARKIAWLFHYPVPAGLIYGLLVYTCMNFAVLPLFRPNSPIHFNLALVNGVMAIVLFIGLAVALINTRFARVPITRR